MVFSHPALFLFSFQSSNIELEDSLTLSDLSKKIQSFLKKHPESADLDAVNSDLDDFENIEILLDNDDENPIVVLD